MWSMTETENEMYSANQNYVAKMMQERALATLLADGITSTNNSLICVCERDIAVASAFTWCEHSPMQYWIK